VGGGVIQAQPWLLEHLHRELLSSLNGYLDLRALVGPIGQYIVPPGLGPLAGPLGALALATDAC
jgi:fructokinase